MTTEGIDKSLHGLGGIEEFPKKMWFSLGRERHKNFDPKELVIPRGFALGKRD